MSYRSTPTVQAALDERDDLKIRLHFLEESGAGPDDLVPIRQEIARLGDTINRLRYNANSDAQSAAHRGASKSEAAE
jgi:hypothetical protein